MYVPLATKYRPQKFSDVVGQDVVVKILTKAIQKDRVGNAILFAGTRGVGKTTLARILAKSLRCENRPDGEFEPCCKCDSCMNFAKDSQIDVIEIDAASNTGVDDVREIIESCRYKPSIGKFKIFIIDEVHMLSKSAFNALLKTLEEPPEHVKFLMATTETYKIPETILSRVLRFDLKKVDGDLIAQYLSSICNRENIFASAEALSIIARFANGSIRDSISILDQAVNVSDKLTASDIREMLYISDDRDLLDLFEIILSSDLKEAVERYRSVISHEVSPHTVLTRLMDYVHYLSCIKADVKLPYDVDRDDACESKLGQLSKNVNLASLSRMWQMLVKGADELKLCDRPEVALEMLIIRLVYALDFPDLRDFLSKTETASLEISKDRDIRDQSNKDSLLNSALRMFPGAKVR